MIEEVIENRRHYIEKCNFNENIFDDLKLSVFLRCQNVADYLYMANDKEIWTHKDFPNIAPPFPNMWFEYRTPEFSNDSGVKKQWTEEMKGCLGVFIKSKEVNFPNVKWICNSFYFIKFNNQREFPPIFLGCLIWMVDADDKSSNKDHVLMMTPHQDINTEKRKQEMLDWLSSLSYTPKLTICFLHCKNVTMKEEFSPSHNLNLSRERKGKVPLLKKYVLEIDQIKKIIRAASNGDAITSKALHICRGHFKDFNARGLFGKHKGIYWWPMQTRGNKEFGEIQKDYEVKL